MYRVSRHIPQLAAALVAGAGLATLWVNLAPGSYYDVIEYRLWTPDLGGWAGLDNPVLTLQRITSEGLMALFIAFLAKELWEALVLQRGALAGARQRLLPLGAVLGGVLGAVVVWLLPRAPVPGLEDLSPFAGWPVPIGADAALCYVFGVRALGRDHPALHLLLFIAIGFDILGLLAMGLDFPTSGLNPLWLILSALGIGPVWAFSARDARPGASERQHRRAAALWPYLLAGAVSWVGVVLSGLPGALGLLPVILVVPHADRSFGLFAEAEELLHDPLNRLAHLLARPLPLVLFLFGLTRGGVDLTAIGPFTPRVLEALWIGKPLGLVAGALAALALKGGKLPAGLHLSDLILIALLSGMGATVPLLALDSALPAGIAAEQARAGMALSLAFGPLAVGLAWVFERLRRRPLAKK